MWNILICFCLYQFYSISIYDTEFRFLWTLIHLEAIYIRYHNYMFNALCSWHDCCWNWTYCLVKVIGHRRLFSFFLRSNVHVVKYEYNFSLANSYRTTEPNGQLRQCIVAEPRTINCHSRFLCSQTIHKMYIRTWIAPRCLIWKLVDMNRRRKQNGDSYLPWVEF